MSKTRNSQDSDKDSIKMVNRRKDSAEFINAFNRVISPGEEYVVKVEEKVTGETILMNPQRQLILQYLSKYPCNHMNGIVRDLGLSYPTVKWHIDLLVKQDFVSYKKIGNLLKLRVFSKESFRGTIHSRSTPCV